MARKRPGLATSLLLAPILLAPSCSRPSCSRSSYVGLEFLDVTAAVDTQLVHSVTKLLDKIQEDVFEFTNISGSVVDTNLLIIVENLSAGTTLLNQSGTTSNGDPFIRVFLEDGVLDPGDPRPLLFG